MTVCPRAAPVSVTQASAKRMGQRVDVVAMLNCRSNDGIIPRFASQRKPNGKVCGQTHRSQSGPAATSPVGKPSNTVICAMRPAVPFPCPHSFALILSLNGLGCAARRTLYGRTAVSKTRPKLDGARPSKTRCSAGFQPAWEGAQGGNGRFADWPPWAVAVLWRAAKAENRWCGRLETCATMRAELDPEMPGPEATLLPRAILYIP